LDPTAKYAVTVLEVLNQKASPSVCHEPRPMHWARKVVRQQRPENDAKILTPIVQVQQ
jgi:hypothetical protein